VAKIGPITLKLDSQKGGQTLVDVSYDIEFDAHDHQAKVAYKEECRLIGDDTNTGDGPSAGPDDTLDFLTPLFNKEIPPPDKASKVPRHFTKTIRTRDLDEDTGSVPNPDEIRAVVTLTPKGGGQPIHRESPMIKRKIG